jgi:hypothetical protein
MSSAPIALGIERAALGHSGALGITFHRLVHVGRFLLSAYRSQPAGKAAWRRSLASCSPGRSPRHDSESKLDGDWLLVCVLFRLCVV